MTTPPEPPDGSQNEPPGVPPDGSQNEPPGVPPDGSQNEPPGVPPDGSQNEPPGVPPDGSQNEPPGIPPPPGWPPHPVPPRSSIGVVLGMTFAGIAIFVITNIAAFVATLNVANSVGSNKGLVVGVGAVILAALALGGGAVLIRMRKPWTRGLGLGLMIGWALMSIVSVGFCTGINPAIYTDGAL